MKKILLSALAGGVFAFLAGWLLFGILLFDVNQKLAGPGMKLVSLPEDQMHFPFLIISNMCFALLLAWLFVKHAQITSAGAGARAGAIFGLLTAIWIDSSFYSMTNLYTLPGIAVDVVSNAFMGAATGAVVAWVISKVRD